MKNVTESQASQSSLHVCTNPLIVSAETPSSHLTADGTASSFKPEPSSQAAAEAVFLGKNGTTGLGCCRNKRKESLNSGPQH